MTSQSQGILSVMWVDNAPKACLKGFLTAQRFVLGT